MSIVRNIVGGIVGNLVGNVVTSEVGGGDGSSGALDVLTVSDSFTDSDSTKLTAHTPEIAPLGSNWADTTSAVHMQGNLAVANLVWNHAYCSIETNKADAKVLARMRGLVGAGSFGVLFRYSDTNNFLMTLLNGTSGDFILYEVVAGVSTALATATGIISTETWYDIETEINGSDYSATVNGTSLSATLASPTAITTHGFRVSQVPSRTDADSFDLYTK